MMTLTNNRIDGYQYDANGNQLTTPDGSVLTYDWNNRMTSWSKTGVGSEAYHYHPSGWRIYKKPSSGAGTLYMYGPGGQLLHEEADTVNAAQSVYAPQTDYIYFAGRLLYVTQRQNPNSLDWAAPVAVYTDRLGTVRARGTGTTLTRTSYYPFGEEIGATDSNTYKYASTYRDSSSGLDYAVNRYYASGMGRFLTVDSGRPSQSSPQSFNRYSYSLSDPVNAFDPEGSDAWYVMCQNNPAFSESTPECNTAKDSGANDGMRVVNSVADPGGGSSDPTAQIKHDAVNAIRKPHCAALLGGTQAVDALNRAKILPDASLGAPVVKGTANSYTWDYQPADTSRRDGNIYYNTNGNGFLDPANLVGNLNGDPNQPIKIDQVAAFNSRYNVQSILGRAATAAEFQIFLVLHELAHIEGKEADTGEFTQGILKDCIK